LKAVGGTVQQDLENTMLPNVGPEAKVVGSAFALQANKISAPIEGKRCLCCKKLSTVKRQF
jgi:peptidyl-prolyl cis-trans isomerase D